MTIEQKAKAYDEALKKARMYRDNAKAVEDYAAVARYENIFPQLRESESEDERIRKELISHFEAIKLVNNQDMFHGFKIDNILSWLEKQKELMPPINVDPCDASWDAYYQRGLNKGYELGLEAGRKEQKPVEWKPSEEQMKALLNIEGDLRAFQYNDKAKIIAELYEQLKRL